MVSKDVLTGLFSFFFIQEKLKCKTSQRARKDLISLGNDEWT